MAMNKAIKHGKEWRKPYRGAKAVDHTCRNNGSCSYCRNRRLFNDKKRKLRVEEQLKEFS